MIVLQGDSKRRHPFFTKWPNRNVKMAGAGKNPTVSQVSFTF
jgi:hypothetical protein